MPFGDFWGGKQHDITSGQVTASPPRRPITPTGAEASDADNAGSGVEESLPVREPPRGSLATLPAFVLRFSAAPATTNEVPLNTVHAFSDTI